MDIIRPGNIPQNTVLQFNIDGSTTGPGYNEKAFHFASIWSVRPKSRQGECC